MRANLIVVRLNGITPSYRGSEKGCVKRGGIWIESAGARACAVVVAAPAETIDREQAWQIKEERQAATVEMQQTVSTEIKKASKTVLMKCDEGQERATGARQEPGAGEIEIQADHDESPRIEVRSGVTLSEKVPGTGPLIC